MRNVETWEIEPGARLQRELTSWATRLTPAELQDHQYQAAFVAVDHALAATIKYMQSRKSGRTADFEEEQQLTDLWLTAGRAVSPINPILADACLMKGLGWTDPSVWETAEKKGLKIGVNDMLEARTLLNTQRRESTSSALASSWFPIAGVCFAAVTILFLMYMLAGPPLDASKKVIFDVMMAFCTSASAAFLGGSAVAHGRIPIFKNSPIAFSAYGGIGIFIVVFLLLHYAETTW